MCIDCLLFHKCINAAREIIRQDMIERLTPTMLLKMSDLFLKCYAVKLTVADLQKEEFLVNKR